MTRTRILQPSRLLLAILVGSFVGLWALTFARAQVVDPTGGMTYPDPRTLGSSWWQLGLLVFALMSSLKRAAGRKWGADQTTWPPLPRNAWTWYLGAMALGIIAAFTLSSMSYGAALTFQGLVYPWTVLAFGGLAGLVGTGGRDVLKWFGELIGEALAGRTATTAPSAAPALPQPGADGSPQVNGNETGAAVLDAGASTLAADQTPLVGVQGFLGLPDLGGLLKGLSPHVRDELLAFIAQALVKLPMAQHATFVIRLIELVPLLPDLFDGSPYLGVASRDRLGGLLNDLQAAARL